MKFAEALTGALRSWYSPGGIKRPVTHRQGLTARLNALERAFGSRKAAARAAGVGERTWRGWFSKSGQRKPTAASLAKVDKAYEKLRRGAAVAKTGTAPALMAVRADVTCDPGKSRYQNKTVYRTFKADQVSPTELADVVQRWQNGGSPDDVAKAAYAAVREAYGQTFAFEGDSVDVDLS